MRYALTATRSPAVVTRNSEFSENFTPHASLAGKNLLNYLKHCSREIFRYNILILASPPGTSMYSHFCARSGRLLHP